MLPMVSKLLLSHNANSPSPLSSVDTCYHYVELTSASGSLRPNHGRLGINLIASKGSDDSNY